MSRSNPARRRGADGACAVEQVLQVLAGERPSFFIDPAAWQGELEHRSRA